MDMNNQNKLKTGLLTTEFWITLATSATGIAVVLGYLTPVEADELIKAIAQVIGGLLTIISTVGYIYGRVALKRQELQNSSQNSTLPASTPMGPTSEMPEVIPQ